MSLPFDIKDLLDRGVALHRRGLAAEAAALYAQAADAGAGAAAYDLLGVALIDQGQIGTAERELRRAIAWEPSRPSSFGNRGNALKRLRRSEEAIASYRRAIAVDDRDPLWRRNLGLILLEFGYRNEARQLFKRLCSLRPDSAEAHNDLGLALSDTPSRDDAEVEFRLAIVLEPAIPAALVNLALSAIGRERPELGAAWARRARIGDPTSADGANALAAAHLAADRPSDASRPARHALALAPEMADAHYNLGLSYMGALNLDAAVRGAGRALAIRPSHAEAEWNLALVRLLSGDFARGWSGYESRWRVRGFPTTPRGFSQPAWEGDDLRGRRILLHAEQGLGDTLQFVRYAPMVAARGGHVILECQPPLRRLLSGMDSIREIRSQGEPLPDFDCHAPLLSLPRIFRTSLGSVPCRIPYLPRPPGTASHPRRKVVGFAWAGSADHRRDRSRSLPVSVARDLAIRLRRQDGVDVASLQLGPRAGELTDLLPAMLTPSGDFLDTAAVVSGISIVVAVDTAIVHLAGSLGVPTVVLLSYVPDFRWLLSRTDSPWYPDLHLLRQSAPGDWGSIASLLEDTVLSLLKN